MRSKFRIKTLLLSLIAVAVLFVAGGFGMNSTAHVHAADAYDLSEWQGHISNRQASRLKNEVSFVILRAQNGSAYQDREYQNSVNKMTRNGVPYGVYSYSLYHNNRQARQEAANLYQRAPQANFYVNDIEQNKAGRHVASATTAWARQMKRYTTRPLILYSYANFIRQNLMPAKKHYNAVWVASYSSRRPATGYKYDLWQYTSSHYSKALGKKIDASKLTGNKPLSFWIGQNGTTSVVRPVKPVTNVAKQNHRAVVRKANVVRTHVRRATRRYRHLSRHELHFYHHEMTHIRHKLARGHRHMNRKERKALRIFKARHGYAFQY